MAINLRNNVTGTGLNLVTNPILKSSATNPVNIGVKTPVNQYKTEDPRYANKTQVNTQVQTTAPMSVNPKYQTTTPVQTQVQTPVNNNQSRFIGFQAPTLQDSLNILQQRQQTQGNTTKKTTTAKTTKNNNYTYDELVKAIQDFHYDVKNSDGKLTKEQISKKYPEFKGKEEEALRLQEALLPYVKDNEFAPIEGIQQYFPDLLQIQQQQEKATGIEGLKQFGAGLKERFEAFGRGIDNLLSKGQSQVDGSGVDLNAYTKYIQDKYGVSYPAKLDKATRDKELEAVKNDPSLLAPYTTKTADDILDVAEGGVDIAFSTFNPVATAAFTTAGGLESMMGGGALTWFGEKMGGIGSVINELPGLKQLRDSLSEENKQRFDMFVANSALGLLMGTKNKQNIIKNPKQFLIENLQPNQISKNFMENVIGISDKAYSGVQRAGKFVKKIGEEKNIVTNGVKNADNVNLKGENIVKNADNTEIKAGEVKQGENKITETNNVTKNGGWSKGKVNESIISKGVDAISEGLGKIKKNIVEPITDAAATKITSTATPQDKLFQAVSPSLNRLTNKRDNYTAKRQNIERGNEIIIEYGYLPKNTTEYYVDVVKAKQDLWKEIQAGLDEHAKTTVNSKELTDYVREAMSDDAKYPLETNKADLAKLTKELDSLDEVGELSLERLEALKQQINAKLNWAKNPTAGEIYEKGLREMNKKISEMEDQMVAELPGELTKFKKDYGALKDMEEDVLKMMLKDMKRKSGGSLYQNRGRLEALGKITTAPLEATLQFMLGESLGKARDVDFLIEKGFKDLKDMYKGEKKTLQVKKAVTAKKDNVTAKKEEPKKEDMSKKEEKTNMKKEPEQKKEDSARKEEKPEKKEDSMSDFVKEMEESSNIKEGEVSYKDISTRTLNKLYESEKTPKSEKAKIEKELEIREADMNGGAKDYDLLDHEYAYRINQLAEEEKRIGKVGKNDVNKAFKEKQSLELKKKVDRLREEMKEDYKDRFSSDAELDEHYNALRNKGINYINEYKLSKNYSTFKQEDELINSLNERWSKQPKFVRELTEEQQNVRESSIGDYKNDNYEIKTTDYQDSFSSKNNPKNKGAIYWGDNERVVVNRIETLKESGLLEKLPDDMKVEVSGEGEIGTIKDLKNLDSEGVLGGEPKTPRNVIGNGKNNATTRFQKNKGTKKMSSSLDSDNKVTGGAKTSSSNNRSINISKEKAREAVTGKKTNATDGGVRMQKTTENNLTNSEKFHYKANGEAYDKNGYVKPEYRYNPREGLPTPRGGWTKKKIEKYLHDFGGQQRGEYRALDAIREFDNAQDFKDHTFYHGTASSFAGKPSMSLTEKQYDKMADRFGGGYGQRYWSISLTTDKKIASNFGGASSSVSIYPVILRKNAKVIEMPKLQDAIDLDEHIEKLWNDGVDAVWIGDKNAGEKELSVLNPNAIVDLNAPDYYRQYHLGMEDNPLMIKSDKDFDKIYEEAPELQENIRKAEREERQVKEKWFKDNYGKTYMELADSEGYAKAREARLKFEESEEAKQIKSKVRDSKYDARSKIKFQKENNKLEQEYEQAVKDGNTDRAKEILKEYAEKNGYKEPEDYKMSHTAPASQLDKADFRNLEKIQEVVDEGYDSNLYAIAQGISSQPADYFSVNGPRWYGYSDAVGMEAYRSIRKAMDDINSQIEKYGEVKDMPKINVYRAVPKDLKEGMMLSEGEWVTPSKQYAQHHGESWLQGDYKILEEEVPADQLWWDGNDMREWGFDDGTKNLTKGVENSRKQLEITYDDKGNLIPLSERFNENIADTRYQKGENIGRSSFTEKSLNKAIENMKKTGLAKDVKTVDTVSDLRKELKGKISKSDLLQVDGEIAGCTTPDGTVYLVKEFLRDDTLKHEFAHRFRSYAEKNNPELFKAINKVAEEAPTELKERIKRDYGELSDDALLDEVFAWKQGEFKVTGAELKWYQKMWKAIEELWNSIKSKFGKNYADLSAFDGWEKMSSEQIMSKINDILENGKKVGKPKNLVTNKRLREQAVWHGSPADFDKFDSSHMGEGEGAQAHGWGHYVAVEERTGRHYADMKNPSNYEYKGRGLKDIDKELWSSKPGEKVELIPIRQMLDSDWMSRYQKGERFDIIKKNGLEEASKQLELSKRMYEKNPEYKERYNIDKRLYDAWKNLDKKDFDFEKPSRNLYNLEIPDPIKKDTPTGSNYLEENPHNSDPNFMKAFITDEQQLEFSKLLSRENKEAGRKFSNRISRLYGNKNMVGGDLYKELSSALGSDKAASQFLNKIGYDGIHYFGGRDGEAYVIFNDDALKINSHTRYQKNGVTSNGKNAVTSKTRFMKSGSENSISQKWINKGVKEVGEGEFGPQYSGLKGKDAEDFLKSQKQGEVIGAYSYKGEPVDLMWGKGEYIDENGKRREGYGLKKLIEKHPEVLGKIDILLELLPEVSRTDNRIKLDNGKYHITISREFNGKRKNWILTAFEITK